MATALRIRLAESARSDFLRQIVATFGTRAGLVAASLVTSVLVSRSLGPDGRGVVAVAGAVTAIGIQLGNLGLHASSTWAVAQRRALLPALTANALVASLTIGIVEAGIVVALLIIAPGLVPLEGAVLIVAMIGIPIGLTHLLFGNLLIGLERIRDYNLLEVGTKGISVIVTIGIVAAGLATPIVFLVAGLVLLVGALIVVFVRLRHLSETPVRPSWSVFAEFGRFGLKAYFTALISFLVIRLDLILIELLQGTADAGQYSIAVACADLVYMLPVVVGTLLFPRLSRMSDAAEQVRYARQVLVSTGALMTTGAIVAALLAAPIIITLYGSAFAPAVPAFIWLLPGIVALSMHTIVMNYCAAVGYPPVVLVSPLLGLVLNVVVNLLLIPRFGIVGASIASSLAYVIMFAISGLYFVVRSRSVLRASEGRPAS